MILLHTLPVDHPLRNKPLGEIGAEIRHKAFNKWRPIGLWRIGKVNYNTLGTVWLDNNEFRAPEQP